MKVNSPFFSIIIPVYNGMRNHLDRCLNSIWSQNIDNSLYEVICIDDCSTDNSREWLKSEVILHPNMIVIENERNIRQGGSRNVGMRNANGIYLMFIDQDDYYDSGALLKIYQHLQKNSLEILIVSNTWELEGRPSNKMQGDRPEKSILSGFEFLEKNGPVFVPWKFVFQKELVFRRNLFLRENVKLGEDIDWTFKMLFAAKKVQYQPIILVHYIRGGANTSNETNRLQILQACISIYNLMQGDECSMEIRDVASNAIRYFANSTIANMFFFNGLSEKKEMLYKFKRSVNMQFPNKIQFVLNHILLVTYVSEVSAVFAKYLMPLWRKYQMKFIWPRIMY